MKIIYKFKPKAGDNNLDISRKAEFLSFGLDPNNNLSVWYLCDKETNISQHITLTIVGTGWELEDNEFYSSNFLGTVNQSGYTWHLFRD